MFPKNKQIEKNYSHFMSEIKEMNKKVFWSENLKRVLLSKLKNIKEIERIIEKKSPYEFPIPPKNANYFSNDKIAIYTSIFGGYDQINEPLVIPDNCDFFIITDEPIKKKTSWEKLEVDLTYYGLDKKSNAEKNRFFKMFPHKIFSEYKYSIYVDGNIKIMTDLTEFIHDMNEYGLKLHGHFRQKCIYKEIQRCKKLKKDTNRNLAKHSEHLIKAGMPQNYGLLEAPIIVRNHNNTTCIKLMEDWWNEFSQYSKRDQISLPYVLWKSHIKIEEIGTLGNDIYSNFAFRKIRHNK